MRKHIVGAAASTVLGVLALALLLGANVSPVHTLTCGAGQFVNALSATGDFACATPAGGGGGGGSGLFNQVLSATPTGATTGFGSGTWVNQGSAAERDSSTGYNIYAPSNGNAEGWHGKYKAAPATPYTVKALFSSQIDTLNQTYPNAGIGWTDGTKLHFFVHDYRNVGAMPWLGVMKYSNATTFNGWDSNCSGQASAAAFYVSNPTWIFLTDDGTNVSFGYSIDGTLADSVTCYTAAKSAAYLGASGYSNIVFGVDSMNSKVQATLMSYSN